MKTLILLLSFSLLTGLVKGQNKRYAVPDPVQNKLLRSSSVNHQTNIGDVVFNSIGENAYKIDSMIIYSVSEEVESEFPEVKETYTYNNLGLNTSLITYNNKGFYDYLLDWTPFMKLTYQYNQKGYQKKFQSFMWEDTLSMYRPMAEQSRFYDTNQMDMDSLIHLVDWDGNGLKPWFTYSIKYGSDGKSVQELEYELNEDSVWFVSGITDYYYDSNGNDTSHVNILYDPDSKTWNKNSKSRFSYDSNGNTVSKEQYKRTENDDKWILEDKTTFVYDDNNRVIELTIYDCDYNTGEDEPETKSVKYYNGNGNIDSTLIYKYDVLDGIWENSDKTIYQYAEGNLVSAADYGWDYSDKKWEEEYLDIYTYNSSIVCNALYCPYYLGVTYPIEHSNLLTDLKEYKWDSGLNDYKLLSHEHYYTSEFQSTNIKAVEQLSIRIYPNPANDVLRIKTINEFQPTALFIYDINGSLRIFQNGVSDNNINVSGLPAGVYILSLQSKNQIYNAQFVKK